MKGVVAFIAGRTDSSLQEPSTESDPEGPVQMRFGQNYWWSIREDAGLNFAPKTRDSQSCSGLAISCESIYLGHHPFLREFLEGSGIPLIQCDIDLRYGHTFGTPKTTPRGQPELPIRGFCSLANWASGFEAEPGMASRVLSQWVQVPSKEVLQPLFTPQKPSSGGTWTLLVWVWVKISHQKYEPQSWVPSM